MLPSNTSASWDFLQGKFLDPGGEAVPSIGLSGQINLTNRMGIQAGQLCASINDWKPFGDDGGEISGLQLCWNPTQHQLTGLGMFELPKAAQKVVGDVYVQVTLQQALSRAGESCRATSSRPRRSSSTTSTPTASRRRPASRSSTSRTPGSRSGSGSTCRTCAPASSTTSPAPTPLTYITDPLIVQVLNALAHPLAGMLSNVYGGVGISFGPEVIAAGVPVNLFRLDGTISLMPPQGPGDNWVSQISAKGTFGRLSPFEMQFANASLVYHWSLTAPEADFEAHVGATQGSFWSTVGGFSGDLRGIIDNDVGNLFEGVSTVKAGRLLGTEDVLVWLDPFHHQATLAACLTAGGVSGVSVGFDYNLTPGSSTATATWARSSIPSLTPQATGRPPAAGAQRALRVRLPARQGAVELAFADTPRRRG